MPTLKRAIQTLSKMSHQNIPTLVSQLNAIQDPSDNQDGIIESLRRSLNELVVANNGLSDPAYCALLALAEFKPLNTEDPIDLKTINEQDKVYTSTGHQFNINMLIQYHNQRTYRDSILGETQNDKWLLNPITNQPFSLRDVAYIQAVAMKKDIPFPHVKIRNEPPKFILSHQDKIDALIRQGLITEAQAIAFPNLSYAIASERTCRLITLHQYPLTDLLFLDNTQWMSISDPGLVTFMINQGKAKTIEDILMLTDKQCANLELSEIRDLIEHKQIPYETAIELDYNQRMALKNPALRDIMLRNGKSIQDVLSLNKTQREILEMHAVLQSITNGQVSLDSILQCTWSQAAAFVNSSVRQMMQENNRDPLEILTFTSIQLYCLESKTIRGLISNGQLSLDNALSLKLQQWANIENGNVAEVLEQLGSNSQCRP